MILAATLVLALAVDTVTFLLLPPGSERNPLVLALGPAAAIALRVAAATALLALSRHLRAWREPLMLAGIVAASVGAGANLSVLL